MSVIATAVRHLLAAGVTGEALVQAIADMEASQPVTDPAADRRRAWDRERKRKAKQLSTGIPPEQVESVETDPLSLPPNEKISNPPTHTPGNITPARKGPIFVCPVGVDQAVWADFLKARKTKGCTNSATAYAKVLRDIAAVSAVTGEPPGRVVEVAAERGWASINDWTEGKPHNGTANRKSPASRDRRDGFAKALDEWIDTGGDPFAASHSVARPDEGFAGNGECGTARVIALRPDSVRTDFADDASGSAHAVYR
jgi:hypothetical protein